jgi:iron complex outermembrane receptor protein
VPTFDLPISVQTVPYQVIQDQNAIKLEGVVQNVSGVQSNNNNMSGYTFNIRGFQSLDVFRDGLKISFGIPQTYDTANLQSVEVLKGPAAFIFGRADPGGIINIVTKKPLDTPYHSVSQQIGSFGLLRTVWDLTGPLQVPAVDAGSVSYRFSGSYTKNGEFPVFVTNDTVFLAPAVAWRIGPATTLTVDGQYLNQNGVQFVGIPALTPISRANPGRPASLPVYRSFQEPNEPPSTVRSATIAYNLRHELDANWTLTNRFLAARSTLDQTVLGAFDFESPPIYNRSIAYQKLTGTNYSANLDLTGKIDVLGVKNDFLIGADYFYTYFNYISSGDGIYPIDIFNPVYGTVPTSEFLSAAAKAWNMTARSSFFESYANKDLGIYAQDSITPFEGLHILLGARYDLADVRDGSSFSEAGSDTPATLGQAYRDFGTQRAQHTGFFSPRVGMVYQPVPWLGFYGSYTRSFGQANGLNRTGAPFPPQVAEGWEGGAKAEFLDHRLLATLAFFDITKSNILTQADPFDPQSGLRPAGLARSQGVEVDILGKLTDEFSVIGSYAHIDARFIADNSGLLGNSLRTYAPDSGSLFLAYDFPNENLLQGWRVGGGIYAASDRWRDDRNTVILPAYARLDAFARYSFNAGPTRISAQINVTNIADTRYYPSADNFYNHGGGAFAIWPGAPRTVIGTLRVEF